MLESRAIPHRVSRHQRRSEGRLLRAQDVEHLQGEYFFRYDEFAADSAWPPHNHSWGHLNYAAQGSMCMDVGDLQLQAPPQYGIWIPPRVLHSCYAPYAVTYYAVYLGPEHSARMPDVPCALRIGAVTRAILADFAARRLQQPDTEADRRMARVLVDQIEQTPVESDYLPAAAHPALLQIQRGMRAAPQDHRSLADWADSVHMTERTLARHSQRELGMSLGEWRQRVRYLQAVQALEAGRSVQAIAFDLGYSTSSAFIAMFQRMAGMSPEQFRREFGLAA